jgi:hypothetical protein
MQRAFFIYDYFSILTAERKCTISMLQQLFLRKAPFGIEFELKRE